MSRHLDLDDPGEDALGIASTFPRPGWVVLDAVRERAFTGQVTCRTTPGVTIWSDRGRIYLAERDDDPSLGHRLVEAGALTDEQLAAGAVQVAGEEHLGRLFERVPDVDRSAVMVANQLMTEYTLGWLASQRVYGATVAPYRHHPSGAHRWEDEAAAPAPAPAPSFPAPAGAPAPFAPPPPTASPSTAMPPPPTMTAPETAPVAPAAPVAAAPAPAPAPTLLLRPLPLPGRGATPPPAPAPLELGVDDVIRWDEPGWLDRPFGDGPSLGGLIAPLPTGVPRVDDPVADVPAPSAADDTVTWTEPAPVADTREPAPRPPAAPPAAPVTADPFERFEVIWPSGEVDEQFGGQPIDGFPNPDIDRAGPTARLVRDGGARGGAAQLLVESGGEAEVDRDLATGVAEIESFLADQATRPDPGDRSGADDDVISAVRSAFASIGSGSLVHGERRIGPRSGAVLSGLTATTTTAEVRRPGRAAVRDTAEVPITSTGRMTHPNPASGSVFDDLPVPAPRAVEVPAAAADDEIEEPAERVTALRRLIGSLRRRNG